MKSEMSLDTGLQRAASRGLARHGAKCPKGLWNILMRSSLHRRLGERAFRLQGFGDSTQPQSTSRTRADTLTTDKGENKAKIGDVETLNLVK